MTGIVALDVVIGLVFVYLLYSMLASLIQEIIATNLGFRAKILQKGIQRMLDDDAVSNALVSRLTSWFKLFIGCNAPEGSLTRKFYEYPFIKYLGEDKWHSKPAYLSAQEFSKVLINLLRGEEVNVGDDFRGKISEALDGTTLSIPSESKRYLKALWVDAQGDVDKFKLLLEQWFDSTMERASGWYKKYTQVLLFFIGFVLAAVFNVDTILIVDKLSKDPELRGQMVKYAGDYLKEKQNLKVELEEQKKRIDVALKPDTGKTATNADSLKAKLTKAQLDSLYQTRVKHIDSVVAKAESLVKTDINKINGLLGLGWEKVCCQKDCCWSRPAGGNKNYLLGWFMTALALSLGAPFWFDLLNKLMKLRSSLVKEEPNSATGNSSAPSTLDRKG